MNYNVFSGTLNPTHFTSLIWANICKYPVPSQLNLLPSVAWKKKLWGSGSAQWLGSYVGWLEFNVPFQHKYGYIRDERSGVESYPLTQWRKANDILTSTLAAFVFSSHPRRERDQETHLNYNTCACNRGRQLSHRKTKLNQMQQKTIILNKNIQLTLNKHKLNPSSVASYDLWPVSEWVSRV